MADGFKDIGNKELSITIQDDTSQSGGGALPTGIFPTKTVCIRHGQLSANQIESRLRLGKPHIITRIKEGMVIFDPRTLNDEEIGKIVARAKQILQEPGLRSQETWRIAIYSFCSGFSC